MPEQKCTVLHVTDLKVDAPYGHGIWLNSCTAFDNDRPTSGGIGLSFVVGPQPAILNDGEGE